MYEARLAAIQAAIREGAFEFLSHAQRRMGERAIGLLAVEDALLNGDPELIEDYPGHGVGRVVWFGVSLARGASCTCS